MYMISTIAVTIRRVITNKYTMFLITVFITLTAIQFGPKVKSQTLVNEKYELIHSTCVGGIPQVKIKYGIKNSLNAWKLTDTNGRKIDMNLIEKGDFMHECNCKTKDTRTKTMAKMKAFDDKQIPTLFHPCYLNNLSAVVRMCMQTPRVDRNIKAQFQIFLDEIFRNEINPILDQLEYCEKAWYNRLTHPKQQEVRPYMPIINPNAEPIIMENLHKYNTYTNFVKSEKQFREMPDGYKKKKQGKSRAMGCKTRCICSPCAAYKYIMGPVTYALEQLFKKQFTGYNVPLNWEQQENKLDEYEKEGFDSTVQLDGKCFDMTQHIELKEMIDHRIYEYIKDKVHHVDPEIFIEVANAKKRKVIPTCIVNGKVEEYGSVNITGEVFSGSCDTTLMNTIRMSLYTRFCAWLANVEVKPWIKGDDTTLFTRRADVEKLVKAIDTVFATEKQWEEDPAIIKGLGQISKFIKVGKIIDFDFCSTMVIKTKEGYKILRKLENIMLKEHFSVKVLQMDFDSYNTDLNKSAKKWLGSENTILKQYIDLVHPVSLTAKPINKKGPKKEYINTNFHYEDAYVDFDYQIEEERISSRNFTEEELMTSITSMVDSEKLLECYSEIQYRVLSQ